MSLMMRSRDEIVVMPDSEQAHIIGRAYVALRERCSNPNSGVTGADYILRDVLLSIIKAKGSPVTLHYIEETVWAYYFISGAVTKEILGTYTLPEFSKRCDKNAGVAWASVQQLLLT